MKSFQQHIVELDSTGQNPSNAGAAPAGAQAAPPENDMRYANKSVGAMGAKEDYFLSQLQAKASTLDPNQRFKILGDVIMTLYPDAGERMRYVNLLRQQTQAG